MSSIVLVAFRWIIHGDTPRRYLPTRVLESRRVNDDTARRAALRTKTNIKANQFGFYEIFYDTNTSEVSVSFELISISELLRHIFAAHILWTHQGRIKKKINSVSDWGEHFGMDIVTWMLIDERIYFEDWVIGYKCILLTANFNCYMWIFFFQ